MGAAAVMIASQGMQSWMFCACSRPPDIPLLVTLTGYQPWFAALRELVTEPEELNSSRPNVNTSPGRTLGRSPLIERGERPGG
jgi:hypothetical protein